MCRILMLPFRFRNCIYDENAMIDQSDLFINLLETSLNIVILEFQKTFKHVTGIP